MADSPPLYGGRSAVLPRGRPWSTSNASTSLPRHPPADSPRHTCGRSASASPMRVMRRNLPPRPTPDPTRQPDPPSPGSLLPALSLSLIHSPHLLSQAPSHGGAPPSSPPLKPLHLAGAPPEDAGERRLRIAPPRSPLLPWGGASPTSFFLYFILFLKPKQGGRDIIYTYWVSPVSTLCTHGATIKLMQVRHRRRPCSATSTPRTEVRMRSRWPVAM